VPSIEFEERLHKGEQLVILEDLVLDISEYKEDHPGGQFLVEHLIGRDITQFFYGSTILEPSSRLSPWRHSD
jgi:cytochrome b involved in lipid metabolism